MADSAANITTAENKMGSAPLLPLICRMAAPTAFSLMAVALYGIIDAAFVAHYSESALTALSLSTPFQTALAAIAGGLGVGVNSIISRALGAKQYDTVDETVSNGLFIALVLGAFFAAISPAITYPLLSLFSDDPVLVGSGAEYLEICMFFSFAVLLEVTIEKILQGSGNMVWPMIFGVVGTVANVVLDPIMIFGLCGFPELGLKGAALATGISQIIALVLSLCVAFRLKFIHFQRVPIYHGKKNRLQIMQIAFPVIIQMSIGSIMMMGMNSILLRFSEIAVNVFSVFYKFNNFLTKPVLGLNYSVMPIVGYNYGAKNRIRLLNAVKVGTCLGICIMVIGMIPFIFCPATLLRLYGANEELLKIGVPAFQILSLYFPLGAVTIMVSTPFSALGKSAYSMIISCMRQIFVLLPLAYLFAKVNLTAVWWSFPLAEIVASTICVLLFRKLYKEKIRKIDE